MGWGGIEIEEIDANEEIEENYFRLYGDGSGYQNSNNSTQMKKLKIC